MGGTADTATLRPLPAADKAPQAAGTRPAPAAGGGGILLRILKLFCAFMLVPACVGASLGIHDHFFTTWSRLNFAVFGPGMMLKWFILGIAAFSVFAILLWRPVVLYVFGHELVHAIATWMCMGKVSNLRASAIGGQVTTSKSNTFIRLAPYCVPLYALMTVGLYSILNTWWRPLHDQAHWLACALGFLYAFHLGFTLWSLRRDQPDLKPDGWLFSLVLIYLANLAVFALLLGFVCDGNAHGAWDALCGSAQSSWQHSARIYHNLAQMAYDIVNGRG